MADSQIKRMDKVKSARAAVRTGIADEKQQKIYNSVNQKCKKYREAKIKKATRV